MQPKLENVLYPKRKESFNTIKSQKRTLSTSPRACICLGVRLEVHMGSISKLSASWSISYRLPVCGEVPPCL